LSIHHAHPCHADWAAPGLCLHRNGRVDHPNPTIALNISNAEFTTICTV
jgi:hypothetical protein